MGPPLHDLIAEVTAQDLQWAVRDILNRWWAPMVSDATKLNDHGYQPYAVLTMCRTVYTLER
jgi:hypothetical protein